jgi:hypothetical protein
LTAWFPSHTATYQPSHQLAVCPSPLRASDSTHLPSALPHHYRLPRPHRPTRLDRLRPPVEQQMSIHPWLEQDQIEEEQKRGLLNVGVRKGVAGILMCETRDEARELGCGRADCVVRERSWDSRMVLGGCWMPVSESVVVTSRPKASGRAGARRPGGRGRDASSPMSRPSIATRPEQHSACRRASPRMYKRANQTLRVKDVRECDSKVVVGVAMEIKARGDSL